MISPEHVAIIMDGNGRWGIKKKKSRNYGHTKGIDVVKNIIDEAILKKIKYLTLFTFSTENWKRPKTEIKFLINILEHYVRKELDNLIKKNIKLKVIGNLEKFPKSLIQKLKKAEKLTRLNDKIQIIIALNYGSKEEIVHAVKKLNNLSIKINEKNISENLYTKNVPDPEILIRTGNRKRLSNFLLWQISYTEIYFVNKLWPDFTRKDFSNIITNFSKVVEAFPTATDRAVCNHFCLEHSPPHVWFRYCLNFLSSRMVLKEEEHSSLGLSGFTVLDCRSAASVNFCTSSAW